MVWEAMIGGRSVTFGNTGGSGIGPERALEAINTFPRAQRESRFLPELPCERRSGPAEPSPGTPKLSERPEGKSPSSPGRSRVESHCLTWFPSYRTDHNSVPVGTWKGGRNVLIRTPLPHTVIEGKRLNPSPGGTSGWVSSQLA
jgi:hypothetical protein